jgi:hypothetical protein
MLDEHRRSTREPAQHRRRRSEATDAVLARRLIQAPKALLSATGSVTINPFGPKT